MIISIENMLQELQSVIPSEQLVTDADILETYGRDETSDLAASPSLVIRARSVSDVSSVLKACNKYKIPVVPRGAGSGVTGGSVPIEGGVVLSMEKMNRILEIDKENMIAVVEPGVVTGTLQYEVRQEGLMYPPDPASLDICSIGGNVAEIAGGPSAVKYGTTKDYVLGMEYVTPEGIVMNTGGKFVKNATGYNISGILLGSEGTLAVITKIYLKLIPAPKHMIDLLIPFDSLETAISTVNTILANRIIPSTIEFLEKDAIALMAAHFNNDIPFPDAGAHLLIQIDGETEELIYQNIETLSEVVQVNLDDIIVAQSDLQRERLWKARRSMREAVETKSPVFLAEDCVVPRSKIAEFVIQLKEYFNSQQYDSVLFGHAGDGNVHIDVLKGDMDYETWKSVLPGLKREIYLRAINLGGTISAEHGIGFVRKEFLGMAYSEDEIELMRRIKKAFDPNGILNPGKIF